MARKIFISYKYSDTNVLALDNVLQTKVRDYVTELQTILSIGHINKGENDGESLKGFKDDTIASKLRDKIYDSTLTIVLISKGMHNPFELEENQWIPWEISYSLKETQRKDKISRTNAVLGVVLPDVLGNYDYFIQENSCTKCNCRTLVTTFLFKILRNNMFNLKNPVYSNCDNHYFMNKPLIGYSSYIHSVKWSEFINDYNSCIEIAYSINENITNYIISKET